MDYLPAHTADPMESDTVHWHTDDCHIRNSASFPVPEFHHTIPDPLFSDKMAHSNHKCSYNNGISSFRLKAASGQTPPGCAPTHPSAGMPECNRNGWAWYFHAAHSDFQNVSVQS